MSEVSTSQTAPAGAPRDDRHWAWLLLLTTLTLVPAVIVHRHLLADGCSFLLRILSAHDFTRFDTARQSAHLLTQAPMVWALRLGVSSGKILSWLYGAGLFLPSAAGLWLTWWAVRRRAPTLMPWALMCWVVLTLATSLFAVTESAIVAAVFWPLFAWLWFWESDLRPAEEWLLVLLSGLLLRTYEGAFPALLLLAFLGGRRMVKRWVAETKVGWPTVLATLLLLVATVVGVIATVNARDPGNRSQALLGMGLFLLRPPAALLALGVAYLLLPAGSLRSRTGLVLTLVAAWLGLRPWLLPHATDAGLHYTMRSLNVLLPPALALLATRPQIAARVAHPGNEPARWVLAALVLASGAWHAGVDRAWNEYLKAYAATLDANEGLVPLASTGLAERGFDWGWTNPSLSIALQTVRGRPVQSLVLNTSSEGYQPFQIEDLDSWPVIDGVTYTPALRAAASAR